MKKRAKTPKQPHPLDVKLGARIKEARLAQRPVMTLEWVARECHCTTQQIQKYETGANRVSFSRLCEIAAALDMSVITLIRPVVQPRPLEP